MKALLLFSVLSIFDSIANGLEVATVSVDPTLYTDPRVAVTDADTHIQAAITALKGQASRPILDAVDVSSPLTDAKVLLE